MIPSLGGQSMEKRTDCVVRNNVYNFSSGFSGGVVWANGLNRIVHQSPFFGRRWTRAMTRKENNDRSAVFDLLVPNQMVLEIVDNYGTGSCLVQENKHLTFCYAPITWHLKVLDKKVFYRLCIVDTALQGWDLMVKILSKK